MRLQERRNHLHAYGRPAAKSARGASDWSNQKSWLFGWVSVQAMDRHSLSTNYASQRFPSPRFEDFAPCPSTKSAVFGIVPFAPSDKYRSCKSGQRVGGLFIFRVKQYTKANMLCALIDDGNLCRGLTRTAYAEDRCCCDAP